LQYSQSSTCDILLLHDARAVLEADGESLEHEFVCIVHEVFQEMKVVSMLLIWIQETVRILCKERTFPIAPIAVLALSWNPELYFLHAFTPFTFSQTSAVD